MTPSQKVATLFLFLGPELTAELVKHMPEDVAKRVLGALSRTAQVSEEDVKKVVEEFLPMLKNSKRSPYSADAAQKILSAARAVIGDDKILTNANDLLAESIQTELQGIADDVLAAWLTNERPSTVALTLSLSEPLHGARVLKLLPKEMHIEVCMQIANLKNAEPSALEALLEELKELGQRSQIAGKSVGGKKVLAAMLQSSGNDLRQSILTKLEEASPLLADELKKQMMTIERMTTMTTNDLSRVCALLSDKEIAYIIKNENKDVGEKLLLAFSSSRRQNIQDEINCLQAIKKSDLDIMREKFINTCEKLHSEGKVIFPWEDEMV